MTDDTRESSAHARRSSSEAIGIGVLGAFSVSIGDRPISESAFGRKKARDLLKVLALEPGHQVHRDRALDLLWPDLDPQAASGQLYKSVHQIRQAFAGANPAAKDWLRFRAGLLTLAAPAGVETDASTFERLSEQAIRATTLQALERAVAAYRGDLLPSDVYEEWTLEHRDRLRERFLEILTGLGVAYSEGARLEEAADTFRQVLRLDPTREAAHRGLMRVYALRGSLDRAAHQYRACQRVLEAELGVAPSPETTALHEQIARGGIEPLSLPHEVMTLHPASAGPLAGRRRELARIVEFLGAEWAGQVRVGTLEGPAGIGKTRLAHEVLRLAQRRGYHALYGAAHEREGPLPYAPMIDAIRIAVRADRGAVELIPAELATSIPEATAGTPIPSADRLAAQQALFAGVLRFLTAHAGGVPLVLVLDDLHAADEGTLKLFHYLARQSSDLRLVLVGSWRTDEAPASTTLQEMMASLTRRTSVLRLVLEPLSESEHDSLVAQFLGGELHPATTARIYAMTAGNPLFASEMVQQLVEDKRLVRIGSTWQLGLADEPAEVPLPIPSSLQSLLRQRMGQLTVAGRRVLDLASVIGQTVPLAVLQAGAASGELQVQDPARLLDLLNEGLSTRLLEEAGLGYRFRHPLLREALHRQMSVGRRQSLHRHVAVTLERLHAAPEERPVEALAHHWREAGDVHEAARYLVAAGDRAEAVYDHDGALARYHEALALLTPIPEERSGLRADLTERIGDVHRATGDVRRSLEAYQQALALLKPEDTGQGLGSREVDLHRKLVLTSIPAGDVATAAEHLARARAASSDDPLDEARLLVAQAFFDWHMNQPEAAVEHAQRALALAEEHEAADEVGQACQMLAAAHFLQGNWDEGLRYESRLVGDWSPEFAVAADAHLCGFDVRIHGPAPYERAERFIQSVADRASAIGSLRCLAVARYALGSMAVLRCQFEVAEDQLARSRELHGRLGSPAGVAYTIARQVELMTARGDAADAGELILNGIETAGQAALRMHALARILAAGLRNRVQVGDFERARELAEVARALASDGGICPVCSPELLPALGEFLVAVGDSEQAWTLAEAAQRIAGMVGNQPGIARSLALKGRAQAARGRVEDADEAFSLAASTLRPLDQPYELARTLDAWGALPGAEDAKREAEQLLSLLRA